MSIFVQIILQDFQIGHLMGEQKWTKVDKNGQK